MANGNTSIDAGVRVTRPATRHAVDRRFAKRHRILAATLAILSFFVAGAEAAVEFDGSFGAAQVRVGDVLVAPSDGRAIGANLFHSFLRFDIDAAESVTFRADAETDNVIARVTGGARSTIDGLLRLDAVGATDLYLINPAGVTFGPSGRVDVPAGLFVATANRLDFADAGFLLVDPDGASQLSTAPPSAFGFLGATANIEIRDGQLRVPSGQRLGIYGGNVELAGGELVAPSGSVTVVAISEGAAPLDGLPNDAALTGARITISEDFATFTAANIDVTGDAPGRAQLAAGTVEMNGGLVFADRFPNASGAQRSTVTVIAPERLSLTNAARITADGFGADAGEVRIVAGRIDISGPGSAVATNGLGGGAAGLLSLDAAEIVLDDTGALQLTGAGLGRLEVTADRLSLSTGAIVNATSTGDAGPTANTVVLTTTAFEVTGSPVHTFTGIVANNVGAGPGPTVLVQGASARLTGVKSGIQTLASSSATGAAGNVRIVADDVQLAAGARLTTRTDGIGDGGDVEIVGGTVRVTDSGDDGTGLFADTFGPGNGGDLRLTGSTVEILGPAVLSTASAFGLSGNAGEITINATDLRIDGGRLSATSRAAAGGDVTLRALANVELSGVTVATLVEGSGTAAGNVTIDASTVRLKDAAVTASTTAPGNGGDVAVRGGTLTIDGGTIAVDTNASGKAGSVTLTAADRLRVDNATISATTNGTGDAGSVSLVAAGATIASSSIAVGSTATGRAGQVAIAADRVQLEPGANVASTTTGAARGGDVRIIGTTVTLATASTVTTSATGAGDAGLVRIEGGTLTANSARVQTTAAASGGGNIEIGFSDLISFRDALVSASAQGSERDDDGGNVRIDPVFLIFAATEVLAQANAGDGGTITLLADNIISDPATRFSATSDLGNDGEVVILTPDSDVNTTLPRADLSFDAPARLVDDCRQSLQQGTAMLTLAARRGVAGIAEGFVPFREIVAEDCGR